MDYFKIAVLNNSGNVGKSTICNTFLLPRIDGAELIRVETINNDDSGESGLSAEDMLEVLEQINITDKAVIDIGSSNIENFMNGIRLNTGSQFDIDFYVIPTTPQVKQQKDTLNTIDNLIDLGVEPENIILVLNKVDAKVNLTRQFDVLLMGEAATTLKRNSLTDFPIINDTEVFSLLEKIKKPYAEVVNDETDYKAAIRATDDRQKRSVLSIQQSAMRLAKGHDSTLNTEFKKLPF